MTQRGQLTEQAYETVKQRLLNGEYKAGDRILVEDLVAELGTSRQPVMDALKRLAWRRFIEIIPQVGIRVVVPEQSERLDFYRMLAATEAVCAGLAAERADKAGVAKLVRINEKIGRLLAEDIDDDERARRYRAMNRDFHRQLNVLAQSDMLTPIAAFMWDHSDFITSATFEGQILMSRLCAAYEEHKLICEAVAANDSDAAGQAAHNHISAFTEIVAGV